MASLRALLPADSGAASSAAGQLGSSLGAALLSTVAATATGVFLASHATASLGTATVHGYTVAMVWGAIILVLATVTVVVLVDASTANRTGRSAS